MTICKAASQSIQTEPERTNGLKMKDTVFIEYPVTYLGSPDWYLSMKRRINERTPEDRAY
jgi:hypothetical protein